MKYIFKQIILAIFLPVLLIGWIVGFLFHILAIGFMRSLEALEWLLEGHENRY